jgi:hypothetical protein
VSVPAKESKLAHIELFLTSPVYLEQMALVTGVNELFSNDEMRKNMLKGSFATF